MPVPYSVVLDDYSSTLRFDFDSLAAALDFLRVPASKHWEAQQTLDRCAAWIADTGSLDGAPFLSTIYPTARLG